MSEVWRNYVRNYNQRYNLPKQLDRARAKVKHLEAKAVRLGMPELVQTEGRP